MTETANPLGDVALTTALPPEALDRARRYVAHLSVDAQDCDELLRMLGLHPDPKQPGSAAKSAEPVDGCGTNAGYTRHYRAGTRACAPCKEAHTRYRSQSR